ncbi:MAG: RNase H family protein, partial [Peptostreptococcus sp.]|nr:RNase H family protein [Peptostreptococcus sp.]
TLDLYFDYNGIEKWCTGEWKTNKEGTKNYKQFYDGIKNRLRVNFYKVKAHSGVDYNELADKLAKESLI